MSRIHKRASSNYEQSLSYGQYSSKLDRLLNQVQIQNRYANRINQFNIRNIHKLEQTKKDLDDMADKVKMNQLEEQDFKMKNQEVIRKINNYERDIKYLLQDLFKSKREIKYLTREVAQLQRANLQLNRDNMQMKRQKIQQIGIVKGQIEKDLISFQVVDFLSSRENTESSLYKICLDIHRKKEYQNLLAVLQLKFKEMEKDKFPSDDNKELIRSKIKLKAIKFNSHRRRIKTQH